jgi:hypothetical protein
MASEFILRGPEQVASIPDISLGRCLYQSLVDGGNKVAMVGVTAVMAVCFMKQYLWICCDKVMLTDGPKPANELVLHCICI